MREVNVPKRLRYEVFNLIVPLDHKTKGWELTGSLGNDRQGSMTL